jgi:hypothetical protein
VPLGSLSSRACARCDPAGIVGKPHLQRLSPRGRARDATAKNTATGTFATPFVPARMGETLPRKPLKDHFCKMAEVLPLQCRKPPPRRPSFSSADIWMLINTVCDKEKRREFALRRFQSEAEDEPPPGATKH